MKWRCAFTVSHLLSTHHFGRSVLAVGVSHDQCVTKTHTLTTVVGLSGGIASGKSTVSRILRENRIPLIDLDEIASLVVQKDSPTLKRLAADFGPSILNEDGTLNRGELGRLAFSSKERTRALNRITHSAIRRVLIWRLIRLWLSGAKRVVVDTPLLIEVGLYKWCAEVVIVWWYVTPICVHAC